MLRCNSCGVTFDTDEDFHRHMRGGCQLVVDPPKED